MRQGLRHLRRREPRRISSAAATPRLRHGIDRSTSRVELKYAASRGYETGFLRALVRGTTAAAGLKAAPGRRSEKTRSATPWTSSARR